MVRQFDVVAIQEVRYKDQTVLQRFVEVINADGSRHDYVIGPRLGRTSSKEQYVFLVDAEWDALDDVFVAVQQDGKRLGTSDDLFHVKPGPHDIVIDLAGHRPKRKRIKIEDGQITRIEVQLKRPPPGQETISWTPAPKEKWLPQQNSWVK